MKVIQERVVHTKFVIYVFITFYTAIPYTNLNSVNRIGSTLFSLVQMAAVDIIFSIGGDKTYFVSHHCDFTKFTLKLTFSKHRNFFYHIYKSCQNMATRVHGQAFPYYRDVIWRKRILGVA